MSDSKPHTIVIMADQLRYDVINERYTPNLYKLKQESTSFERAYCASPLCVPARGAFFSGQYPNVNGSLINPWEPLDAKYGEVRPGTANLYSLMETQWDSWHTGKQHFNMVNVEQQCAATNWHTLEEHYGPYLDKHGKRAPGGPRFKGIVPEMVGGKTTRMKRYSIPTTGCYEEGLDYFFDGFITNTSIDAIRNRDRGKPFLLNAMFVAPHPPLDVPEPWYSMYKDEPVPDNVGQWFSGQSPLQLYNLTGVVGNGYTREQWEHIWQVYLGLVTLLDHCVGKIIDELKVQGMYDNSLIMFTSDHGEMLGSHRLYQKMCMYEESVRTPLFIKMPVHAGEQTSPKTAAARLVYEPVSAVDVLPTLADYLQFSQEEEDGSFSFSGRSLMPLLNGEELTQRDVFIQFDGNGARGNYQRAIIRESHKLIVDLFKDECFIELYDLADDLQETRNLAFDQANRDEIEKLLASLRVHMNETGDLLELPAQVYNRFLEQYSPFQRR